VLGELPAEDEDCEGMYRVRFEDGTEIEAWGLEVCVWDQEAEAADAAESEAGA
jgi:hypothetical protein